MFSRSLFINVLCLIRSKHLSVQCCRVCLLMKIQIIIPVIKVEKLPYCCLTLPESQGSVELQKWPTTQEFCICLKLDALVCLAFLLGPLRHACNFRRVYVPPFPYIILGLCEQKLIEINLFF
jgi:hypothetical protein